MSFKISSVSEYFQTLDKRFVADASKGVNAIYQFELAGDQGGTWHIVVDDGSMNVNEGAHDSPTTTLKMVDTDYIAMTNGELNGQMAYMRGKLKIAGNIAMAMKMKNIFPQA